jgi:hypothetical protein
MANVTTSATATTADEEKHLKELWANAFDCFIDVRVPLPSEYARLMEKSSDADTSRVTLYFRPCDVTDTVAKNDANTAATGGDAVTPRLPEGMTDFISFALTGWNPMGREVSEQENTSANNELQDALHRYASDNAQACTPGAIFNSFGFSPEWREEGFVFMVHRNNVDSVRHGIVSLAKVYKQGAIYEYRPLSDTQLLRKTVPVLMTEVEADVRVQVCQKPPIA